MIGLTEARQRWITGASFFTIMHRQIVSLPAMEVRLRRRDNIRRKDLV